MTETRLIWRPLGTAVLELTHANRIARVEPGRIHHGDSSTSAWRASTRRPSDPPTSLLEFAWFTDRNEAMKWCGARLTPHASADEIVHLIGEAA